MQRYTFRDISREDAARACGMSTSNLDVFIHRHGPLGGKRGGARLFSVRDVVTIACARKLEGAGLLVREALRVCGELLHDPPKADDILVIEDGNVRLVRGDFNVADSNAESVTCLWVGHVADHALSKLEPANVALQD